MQKWEYCLVIVQAKGKGKSYSITMYSPEHKIELSGDMKKVHQTYSDLGKQSWEAVGSGTWPGDVQQTLFKRPKGGIGVDTQPGPATIELTAEVAQRLAEVLEEMKE